MKNFIFLTFLLVFTACNEDTAPTQSSTSDDSPPTEDSVPLPNECEGFECVVYSHKLAVPYIIDMDDNVKSYLNIQNPDPSKSANVRLKYYNITGSLASTSEFILPPHTSTSFRPTKSHDDTSFDIAEINEAGFSQNPEIGNRHLGNATLESDIPIVGRIAGKVGIQEYGFALSKIDANSTKLSVPYILDNPICNGSTLTNTTCAQSFIAIQNPNNESASITITFYNLDGTLAKYVNPTVTTTLVDAIFNLSLQANASTSFRPTNVAFENTNLLPGLKNILFSPNNQVGSAIISSSLPIAGRIQNIGLFNHAYALPKIMETQSPLSTTWAKDMILSNPNTSGIISYLAVSNPTSQSASVNLEYRDEFGMVVKNKSVDILPFSAKSIRSICFVSLVECVNGEPNLNLLPNSVPELKGNITLSSNVEITGRIAHFYASKNAAGTLNIGKSYSNELVRIDQGKQKLSVPYILDSDNSKAKIVIFNPNSSQADIEIQYYDISGNPVTNVNFILPPLSSIRFRPTDQEERSNPNIPTGNANFGVANPDVGSAVIMSSVSILGSYQNLGDWNFGFLLPRL